VNFREFEHAGWEKLPGRYHDAFGSLTTQTIEPLLDAAGARKGIRLLDVASGPGYVAAAAAARGASVTGRYRCGFRGRDGRGREAPVSGHRIPAR
jgi:2-polyprenyl-3-methyl-5-hydroxy-6-metoxy-1,4-benzoquinol methylase